MDRTRRSRRSRGGPGQEQPLRDFWRALIASDLELVWRYVVHVGTALRVEGITRSSRWMQILLCLPHHVFSPWLRLQYLRRQVFVGTTVLDITGTVPTTQAKQHPKERDVTVSQFCCLKALSLTPCTSKHWPYVKCCVALPLPLKKSITWLEQCRHI